MTATLRGIKYPIKIKNGAIVLVEDADLIKSHILSVLQTEPGERIVQPRYGTPDFLFSGVRDINVIAQLVRQRLTAEIPQADFAVGGRLSDGGGAILTVAWGIDGQPQAPLNFELLG